MELPVDEEHNEEVVGVPEPLKVRTAAFLHCEPHHDTQSDDHDPSSRTRTGDKIGSEEGDDALARCRRIGIEHGQLGKVDHVCGGVEC